MTMEWQYSEDSRRWEYGYTKKDIDRNTSEWVMRGYITQDTIDHILDKCRFSDLVREHFGSLPPPLKDLKTNTAKE